jgi:hypothetical protein
MEPYSLPTGTEGNMKYLRITVFPLEHKAAAAAVKTRLTASLNRHRQQILFSMTQDSSEWVINPTLGELYLHNLQHSQDTDIHGPAGFGLVISAWERSKTHALDRAPTGINNIY